MSRSPMLWRLGVVVSMLLFGSVAGAAQGWQRSSVVGDVQDASGAAIAGAIVTISGDVLGGPRETPTDETGRYRFTGLLPGKYRVSVRSDGFRPAITADFPLPVETTYSVDLLLQIAATSEQVTVISKSPLIDVQAASRAILYSSDLLETLPTTRSLTAVLNLAPGVTDDVAFGGTQSSSNRLSLDGVVVNAAYLGEQWVRPHYNWFREVQIVGGGGASAEYGGFTGAIANGVLRSGGNRYSALAEYVTVRPSWSGDNTAGLPDGAVRPTPRTILGWRDVDAQMGAPIHRDRAWIFGAFSHMDHQFRNFGYSGPDATEETAAKWMLKLDVAARPGVALQGFFLRDSSNVIGFDLGHSRPTSVSASDVLQRKHAWNGRITWARRATTSIEVRTGGHFGTSSREPHPPGTRTGPRATIDERGIISGNAPYYLWSDSTAATVAASLTHYVTAGPGRHEVRAGTELERNSGREESGYTAGGVFYYSGGTLVFADLWDGDRIATRNRRTTLYVQDRWTLSRLTVESGLRLDFYDGRVPGLGGVFATRPLGLRLGAAWDITGEQETLLRAHYGRYHDPQFGYLYGFAHRAQRNPIVGAAFLPDGSSGEAYRIDPDVTTTIDRPLRQPRVDQLSGSVERRLGSDFSVELQYVHRRYGDFIGYIDPRIGEWTQFTVNDPGPDGRGGTSDDGGLVVGYVPYDGPRVNRLGNVTDAWRRYNALQLTARKRLATRWQMEASFTASKSRGTVDTAVNTNIAWASLSPAGGIGTDGGLRATARRRPTHDFSEAKVLGAYDAPWLGGFRLGGVFRWRNGMRWHRLMRVGSPYFTNLPAEEPNSRRTPSLPNLDLRVEKTVALPRPYGRLGLYADIFNVANVGRALNYTRMSGPLFGQPGGWTDPRTMQIGVRFAF